MDKQWKENFVQLPGALQRQILIRAGMGLVSGILFLGILIYTGEWSFALPCLVLTLFLIVNGWSLFYNCNEGRYVVVNGRCTKVGRTGGKKRVKYLYVAAEDKMLTVFIPYRLKAPAVADGITVYLPVDAPVYEADGEYCIYHFYALEINRKV